MTQIAALDAWESAAKAALMLLDHVERQIDVESSLYIILANQTLAIIVSGYEAYCERRFGELIIAGCPIDYARMDRKLVPQAKQGDDVGIERHDATRSVAFARQIIRRYRINFQDFENGKRAYTAAFGIRFGDLGLSPGALEALQVYLRYRHRIVHVSPLLAVLNAPEDDVTGPVFASAATVKSALLVFDGFIQALHRRTLEFEDKV
jgi:hypothetical protein